MDQTSETEKIYQRKIYDEICGILLAAGYFRVRINTLSEFDKVVGGLCWCIVSSGEAVDVDILFQENSTIGQKIALSEAIVAALRKMGCPAPLQPHQIQGGVGGSDYPALHQVITWLVKKYFERRGEREMKLRKYSMFQFSRNYQLPTEVSADYHSECFSKILARNKATRLFKRKEMATESEETRVRSCLMEFGETFATVGGSAEEGQAVDGLSSVDMDLQQLDIKGVDGTPEGTAKSAAAAVESARRKNASGGQHNQPDGNSGSSPTRAMVTIAGESSESGGGQIMHVNMMDSAVDVTLAGLAKFDTTELSGFEKQLAKAARDAKREEQKFAAEISKEEAELKRQMQQIDDQSSGAVSGSQVGNIVGLGLDEIGSALAAYKAEVEESRKQMDENLASGKMGQAAAFNRQKQNLLRQKDEAEAKMREMKMTMDSTLEKLRLIEEERDGAVEYLDQLDAQLKKLDTLEKQSTQQDELKIVQDLVAKHEALKLEEAAYKASCKAQRQEFLDKIAGLEAEMSDETEENEKLKDVEAMHTKILSKYNRLRQMLAEVNLEIAQAARTIDDTPTRTELIQYERRFVELYQQVAWKLEETRKYYDMYNTLDTTLGFLQKEVKLLNSISENFHEAMKSTSSKMEFSKQFETIVKGVQDSLRRQTNLLQQKDQQVEKSKQLYQNLVDEQRKYFKAVKDFQDECNKNDWLMSKLEQLTRQ